MKITFAAAPQGTAQSAIAAEGQQIVSGTPGVASLRAVMNFAELAGQPSNSAVRTQTDFARAAMGFMPAGAGATLPPPAPASSFMGCEDDGTDLRMSS